MIFIVLFACWIFAARAVAACDRGALQELTAAYVRAQSAGKPSLLPLSVNVSYMENDVPLDIQQGVLSRAIAIDFNRSLHDTNQCATFTELTAATDNYPSVIDTRILLVDGEITKIETIVADDGDWVFNATSHLLWTRTESWDPIPEHERDSRAVIKAAGDAYLDNCMAINSLLNEPRN
jgi:hypothetical protein